MTEASLAERNKATVRRFNDRVISALDETVYRDIFTADFINHSAPPGAPNGSEGMWNTFANVMHPAFPDLTVEIEDQLADGVGLSGRQTAASPSIVARKW